jgi:hypothetical protein
MAVALARTWWTVSFAAHGTSLRSRETLQHALTLVVLYDGLVATMWYRYSTRVLSLETVLLRLQERGEGHSEMRLCFYQAGDGAAEPLVFPPIIRHVLVLWMVHLSGTAHVGVVHSLWPAQSSWPVHSHASQVAHSHTSQVAHSHTSQVAHSHSSQVAHSHTS